MEMSLAILKKHHSNPIFVNHATLPGYLIRVFNIRLRVRNF